MPRKKKEREKLPAMLAVEIGLKCKQFKPGTREMCGTLAVGHLPNFGDSCEVCARGRKMIRYATSRKEMQKADIAA
jgi:hypothetical protein